MGWKRHFDRFPSGDYHLQMIVAQLTAAVRGFLSGKPVSVFDVAPWLELPGERAKREAEDAEAQRDHLMALAFADWQTEGAEAE